VFKELKVYKELRVLAFKVFRVSKALRDFKELKVYKELRV
jgi:hypothetical protein